MRSSQTRPLAHSMPPSPSIISFHRIDLGRLAADLVNGEGLGLHARHAGRAHGHARQGDAGAVGALVEQPVAGADRHVAAHHVVVDLSKVAALTLTGDAVRTAQRELGSASCREKDVQYGLSTGGSDSIKKK